MSALGLMGSAFNVLCCKAQTSHLVSPALCSLTVPWPQQGAISQQGKSHGDTMEAQIPLYPPPRHSCVPRGDVTHPACLGQDTGAFLNVRK